MNLLQPYVPGCGLLLLIISDIFYVRSSRKKGKLQSFVTGLWTVPAVIALTILLLFSAQGLCRSNSIFVLESLVFVITLSGLAVLLRDRVQSFVDSVFGRHRVLFRYCLNGVLLVVATVVALFTIELPWNDAFVHFEPWKMIVNIVPLGMIILSLYLIFQCRGSVVVLCSIVALLIGLAQYFVALFKGAAIVPSDLFALGTALSVTGGYEFVLGARQIFCIALTCTMVTLLSYSPPVSARQAKTLPVNKKCYFILPLARVLAGFSLISLLFSTLMHVNFSDVFGFSRSYWDSLSTYSNQGFTASFISLIQNSVIAEPDGYSRTEAGNIRSIYARNYMNTRGGSPDRMAAERQFSDQRPTIVAIMNESFSDLSIFEGLHAGYEGPEYVTGIPDALYKGYTYVSVLGGGTCNSEFEFLTGAALAFVGAENQPYITHDLSRVHSLPKALAELGYRSTAIHPMPGENWNRDVVYPSIGFDTFLDDEAFPEDAPVRHSGITDGATYEEILRLLEDDDSPQFIFDVTMQNHGGYDNWDLPDAERLDIDLSWTDDVRKGILEEYLSLVSISDRELEEFVDALRKIDRPVILVFFGDHQLAAGLVSSVYGDRYANQIEYIQMARCTPYFIWANYDVEGNAQVSQRRDIGLFALQSLLFDAIGAPMTEQQKATMGFMEEVPILNAYGYQTNDGVWHSLDDEAQWEQAVRDLEWIQYLEYGSRM